VFIAAIPENDRESYNRMDVPEFWVRDVKDKGSADK